MTPHATPAADAPPTQHDGKPYIHPQALVETGDVGQGTRVWAFAHLLPGSVVGRDCNICDGVFIEGGAVVGDRVTVKCGVQLWTGVTLEDDAFIGPNATFTNDPFPRSRQHPRSYARTVVRKGASIGANATILPGITIGERAMIGAGAVVTHDVPAGAVVVGNPGRVVKNLDDVAIRPRDDEQAPARGLAGVRVVDIPEIRDERGSLTFGQFDSHVPFVPHRYFTIMDVPAGTRRGGHAHRTVEQFIVALRGRVVVSLDDGDATRQVVLDSPRRALYIPPLVWNDLSELSPEGVILGLASEAYNEREYIRDRATFDRETRSA